MIFGNMLQNQQPPEEDYNSFQQSSPIEQKPMDRTDLFLPIRKAQEMGATEDQILEAISSNYPEYAQKIQQAREMGATDSQIFKGINRRPDFKEDPLRHLGRKATQGAIGISDALALGYNIAATGAKAIYDMSGASGKWLHDNEIKRLQDKQQVSDLSEDDKKKLEHYMKMSGSTPDSEFPSLDTASLVEKGFEQVGIDMQPEDFIEHAMRFVGLYKDPKKIFTTAKEFYKDPRKAADLAKAVTPTVTEATRAFGATTGLEMAKEGQFGSIGTMASIVLGDLLGGGIAEATKATSKAALQTGKSIYNDPKAAMQATKEKSAKALAFMTRRSRREIGDSLASNMEQSGLEADLGTLTNSNLIRMVQTQLEHSGLVGQDLEQLRTRITDQITKEYARIVHDLGEGKYKTIEEATETIVKMAQDFSLPLEGTTSKVSKVTSPLIQQKKHNPIDKVDMSKRLEKGRVMIEDLPDPYKDFLGSISLRPFESAEKAGRELKEVANEIKQPLQDSFNKRFESINGKIDSLLMGSELPKLIENLKTFLKETQGSLLEGSSTAESSVIKETKKLLSQLENKGNAGIDKYPPKIREQIYAQLGSTDEVGIKLRSVRQTLTTLGDITDFDFGGSKFKGKFKYIYGELNESLMNTIEKIDPKLAKEYKALKKDYSKFKEVFENKDVLKLFEDKNKSYNKIYESFLNPDNIRSLKEILNTKNPEGYSSIKANRTLRSMQRDYAAKVFAKGSLDERAINDLKDVLGKDRTLLFKRLKSELERQSKGAQPELIKTPVPKDLRPGKPQAAKKGLNLKEESMKSMKEKNALNVLQKKVRGMTPEQIFAKMNSVSGIKELETLLKDLPGGTETLNNLKSLKMEKMIGEGMVDSVTHQLKLGTFSKILEKGNNRDIAKHILGQEGYRDLVFLQNHTAELQKSGQKFFNSSGSSTSHKDWSISMSILSGFLTGNPWMVGEVFGGLQATKKMAKLLSDQEFLTLARDAIIAEERNNTQLLKYSWEKIIEKIKASKEPLKKAVKESSKSAIES